MRAKFIYEKFTDESDPIHDMGIGAVHELKDCVERLFYEDDHTGILCADTFGCFKYVSIKNSQFIIRVYAESFKNQEGYPINKKNYIIKLLQKIEIFQFFEKRIKDELREYDDIEFTIKDEFVKFFKNGRYDGWDYRHGLKFYHPFK
jgi:hypothetical protein